MVDIPFDAIAGISPAEVGEVEFYHPKSWRTRYVFSQDAKVIAVQYSITAMSMGDYDIVAVYEAPDDAVAARFNLQLGMLGNVRTRTLKAFPEAAYREIITSLG